MADLPPWNTIKPIGTGRITQKDVENGKRALKLYKQSWASKNRTHFPWNQLFHSIRICQIFLRVGVDPLVFRKFDKNIVDTKLPLSDAAISSLLPNDQNAQHAVKVEQARCFGTFMFNKKATQFEDDELVPFKKLEKGNLGDGAFSVVDKVEYTHPRRPGEAVVFARKRPKSNDMVKVFENEIKISKELGNHHHVVRYQGSYKHRSEMGIILYPAADNGNLEEYLLVGEEADHDLLKRLFGCLSMGLSFLNNACNLRHKDVKASNILIHGTDILFTDFGSAFLFTDSHGKTQNPSPGMVSQRYAAPEVLAGSERNVKTDLFALGCIFAEVLTVLAYQSVTELHDHIREGQEDQDVLYGNNTIRLQNWLKTHCQDDAELQLPLSWCLEMIEQDVEQRPHITELIHKMSRTCKDLNQFFCTKCIKKLQLTKGQKSSPRGHKSRAR